MAARFSAVIALIAASAAAVAFAPAAAGADTTRSAAEAIREAVRARVGGDADVVIHSIDGAAADLSVREARPRPGARLGDPIGFTLIAASGETLSVTARLDVIATHAVAQEPVGRGHVIQPEAIADVRGLMTNLPLTRVVQRAEAVGVKALRPIDRGAVLLPAALDLRRAVEPGDPVTASALAGSIEVTATVVAVDGGEPGAVIRVRNGDLRRYIRARVVSAGRVEVIR